MQTLMDVYQNLYAEVIPVIYRMNMDGVPVDVERLKQVREFLKALISDYEEKIFEETGHKINVKSPPQVADLLFNSLKMTPYKGEKTGKKTLEKLAYKYQSDIPKYIIDLRAGYKELNLFSSENIIDGHIKCEYSPRASTGRFKSRKGRGRGGMNLQNVKVGEQRKFFIPPPGHVMIGADQKQAEAMAVGWFADDSRMQSMFDSGKSLHLENLYNVFGVRITSAEKDTNLLYKVAKGLIHGGNYGLGPWKFARMANIPFAEAKKHLDTYHRTYPGIRKNFHGFVQSELKRSRMLYNPFGRRQVFFSRMNDDTFRAGYAFLPQSTISDINKTALKQIAKHYRILIELHDGLYIAVPEGEVKFGIEAMQEAYDVRFYIWGIQRRIPIDVSIGPNWDEMQKVDI
uniref:Putative DNA polymerase n=1 Tax=viral metagenome TaxID=1070528 RepID=A0A6M3L9W6_9ZZZZ